MEQTGALPPAGKPIPAYPTLKESWGAIGWYLLILVLLVMVVWMPVKVIVHLSELNNTVLTLMLTAIANVLLVLWLRRRAGPGRWVALPWQPPRRPWAAVGLLLLATVSLAIILSVQQLVHLPRWSASKWLSVLTTHPLLALVFGCLLAPVTEEIIFRGVLLRGLLCNYRPAVAIGQSALLFGLVHVNPAQMLNAFLIGLLLGWIYYRSHSLWLCIGLHGFYNTLAFGAGMAPWQAGIRQLQSSMGWSGYALLWLGAALVLAACLAALVRSQHDKKAVSL